MDKESRSEPVDNDQEPIEERRYELDLRGVVCPMTLVRAKLKLEALKAGDLLEVTVDHYPALTDMPEALKLEGHTIIEKKEVGEKMWKILIQKAREK